MEDNQFTNLLAVLDEYGNAFRNLYQDKLISADKIATGDLLNSVEYRVSVDGTAYEVVLSLAEYWKYIENGRPQGAKMPPPSAILEWINVKPVVPRPDEKTGRVPSPEQLSWKIAKSIKAKTDKGPIPGTPLMAQTYEELNAYYRPRIAAAFRADTLQLLKLSAFGGISSQLNRE